MKIVYLEIIGTDSEQAISELVSNAQYDNLKIRIYKLPETRIPTYEKRERLYIGE